MVAGFPQRLWKSLFKCGKPCGKVLFIKKDFHRVFLFESKKKSIRKTHLLRLKDVLRMLYYPRAVFINGKKLVGCDPFYLLFSAFSFAITASLSFTIKVG